jgi:uncharacterized protein YraI
MIARMKSSLLAAVLLAASVSYAAALSVQVREDAELRWGPGNDFPVIAVVPAGDRFNVQRCSSSWCKGTWRGNEGFIERTLLALADDGVEYVEVFPDYEVYEGYVYGPGFGFIIAGDFHRRRESRAVVHFRRESRALRHTRTESRVWRHRPADSRARWQARSKDHARAASRAQGRSKKATPSQRRVLRQRFDRPRRFQTQRQIQRRQLIQRQPRIQTQRRFQRQTIQPRSFQRTQPVQRSLPSQKPGRSQWLR